jgi:hypothetical protein
LRSVSKELLRNSLRDIYHRNAVLAQRRVYAESWPKTVVKAISVAALYGVLWAATTFCVVLWVTLD